MSKLSKRIIIAYIALMGLSVLVAAGIILATFFSESGINMAPPPENAVNFTEAELVEVRFNADGAMEFNGAVYTEMEALLRELDGLEPDTRVILVVPDTTPHGMVIEILDHLTGKAITVSLTRAPGE